MKIVASASNPTKARLPRVAEAAQILDLRYERKFHAAGIPSQEAESWIRGCPVEFSECYPPRHVNNIYFDNHELRSYFQSLEGASQRVKIRVRWYDRLFGRLSSPVLEFKFKEGLLGRKLLFPLPAFRLEPGVSRGDLEAVVSDDMLPMSVRERLRCLDPILVNRYYRKYFATKDGKYRMTLDLDLEFYRFFQTENSFLTLRNMSRHTILELKYPAGTHELDPRIANHFPLRVSRVSKYVMGVDCLGLN